MSKKPKKSRRAERQPESAPSSEAEIDPPGTLWTASVDPSDNTLAGIDTTRDASKIARQIRDMPERDISEQIAPFVRIPLTSDTLKRPTGR